MSAGSHIQAAHFIANYCQGCAVFSQRVLEGAITRTSGLSSKPRNLKWQLVWGLVIQLSGLRLCQWLENLCFIWICSHWARTVSPSTLILLETTAFLARGMLGRHSDHEVYFLKVKITVEMGPESNRKNDPPPPQCIAWQLDTRCLCMVLVLWEDAMGLLWGENQGLLFPLFLSFFLSRDFISSSTSNYGSSFITGMVGGTHTVREENRKTKACFLDVVDE